MNVNLSKKEKLVWELLFGKKNTFEIDLDSYCTIEERPIFRESIRFAIRKGGRSIVEDLIIHRNNKLTIWKLVIKCDSINI
jgi:predicted ABC-type ATPase